MTKRKKLRRHPLSSIRAKITLILLAMAGTSAACGFAVFFAFDRVSEDMDGLVQEKLPQMNISSELMAAASKTKNTMVSVMLAQHEEELDAASVEVTAALNKLEARVNQLTSSLRSTFEADLMQVKTKMQASIDAKAASFKNSAHVVEQTIALQKLSSNLQGILSEIADDAYFNLSMGGEETITSVEGTLTSLVEEKFGILQMLLEARAEVSMLSGVALATSMSRKRSMLNILNDLGASAHNRFSVILENLEANGDGTIDLEQLRSANETLYKATKQSGFVGESLREEVLSVRQSTDAFLMSAVDDMVFELTIAAEEASAGNREAIQSLMDNEVGFLNTLLEIDTWISGFQVAALDVVSAKGAEESRVAAIPMSRAAEALKVYLDFNDGILAKDLKAMIALTDPETGIATYKAASFDADAKAMAEAAASAEAVLQIAGRASQLGSESQGEIGEMAAGILYEVSDARVKLEYLMMFSGGLFVASLLLTHWLVQKPLNSISQTTERLASGELSPITGYERSSDEIRRIAEALTVFRNDLVEKQELAKTTEKERAAHAAQQTAAVSAIGTALGHLSRGNLSFRITEDLAEGYEKLKADYNKTVETLRSTVTDVVETSGSIKHGVTELGQSSDDLATRTENQAATLEQTAAALDQMTGTVKQAAEGAKSVEEVVKNARSEAEASGAVVESAVAAMTEIEQSSEHISQIIRVIDDIAFQTNLLALNAGVEAARAGDAGKGFAVVASEVRALAQRSSEAAKEIKTLIDSSSQQVEQGVELVGKAGEALSSIVEQVTNISTHVSQIAEGAVEQSTGLQEINLGVNELEKVTQQNAAMVEESTAACHLLNSDTNTLSNLVSHFQVGNAGGNGSNVLSFDHHDDAGTPSFAEEQPEEFKQTADGYTPTSKQNEDNIWEDF